MYHLIALVEEPGGAYSTQIYPGIGMEIHLLARGASFKACSIGLIVSQVFQYHL